MKTGKAVGRHSGPKRNVAKLPASVRIRKPAASDASESLGRSFQEGWNSSVRLQLQEVSNEQQPSKKQSALRDRYVSIGVDATFMALQSGWKLVCCALGVSRLTAVGFKPFAGTLPSLSSVIAAVKEASSLAGQYGGFPQPMPWDTQTLNISDFMRSSRKHVVESSGGSTSSPAPTECDAEMPPIEAVKEAEAALPTPQQDDTLYDILDQMLDD